MNVNSIEEKIQDCEVMIKMNPSVYKIIHTCPHCGFTVTGNDGISMFFGWRKSFRMTREPNYKLIPQSWCLVCRKLQVRRYE